jgi:hypothetical protein
MPTAVRGVKRSRARTRLFSRPGLIVYDEAVNGMESDQIRRQPGQLMERLLLLPAVCECLSPLSDPTLC